MPHTAWATIATATIFSPCRMPAGNASPQLEIPSPNSVSARAEGSVNPAQAASAPGKPPRIRPMASPTWLLAGPGRNWQSATRSA